jgi:hypothetical protein
MELSFNVFDVWVIRRVPRGVEYLLLYTWLQMANRHFNGGRSWQIPSGFVEGSEGVVGEITRRLKDFGLVASAIWAAEHTYTIYNRRFDSTQIIAVFAAEVGGEYPTLNPDEHSEFRWCSLEEALSMVHDRGLKDGLRSTFDYVTGMTTPARELRLS